MPCASSRSSEVARLGLFERLGRGGRRDSSPPRAARCASLSVTIMCTRRCCAPSCRSRTTRRRASSAAVSRRAREATSGRGRRRSRSPSPRSSVEVRHALLGVRRQRLVAGRHASLAPQSLPPDEDRGRDRRREMPRQGVPPRTREQRGASSSTRTARRAPGPRPGSSKARPSSDSPPAFSSADAAPQRGRRPVVMLSGSSRAITGAVGAEEPPSSSATAVNTSAGGAAGATSVATRRSAVCWS